MGSETDIRWKSISDFSRFNLVTPQRPSLLYTYNRTIGYTIASAAWEGSRSWSSNWNFLQKKQWYTQPPRAGVTAVGQQQLYRGSSGSMGISSSMDKCISSWTTFLHLKKHQQQWPQPYTKRNLVAVKTDPSCVFSIMYRTTIHFHRCMRSITYNIPKARLFPSKLALTPVYSSRISIPVPM